MKEDIDLCLVEMRKVRFGTFNPDSFYQFAQVLFFFRHSIRFIELSLFLKLYTGQSVRNGTEANGKVD